MDTAEVIQVIRTTLTRRGDGKGDPIRIITQFWSLDGAMLAEVDPLAGQSETHAPTLQAMPAWVTAARD